MKRRSALATALVSTLLLSVPLESEAFFGFFGGGFSFGFGGGFGGWGGPGWWGPSYWGGPGYWGYPGYYWYRPYYWHRYGPFGPYYGGYRYSYPYYGLIPPVAYVPQVVIPTVRVPATSEEK